MKFNNHCRGSFHFYVLKILGLLGNFSCIIVVCCFVLYSRLTFSKVLSGILSVSTVWIQIRHDLGPNCLQMLSADDTGRQRFNYYLASGDYCLLLITFANNLREHRGSVVECLTRDQGAACKSLTGVTVLCP